MHDLVQPRARNRRRGRRALGVLALTMTFAGTLAVSGTATAASSKKAKVDPAGILRLSVNFDATGGLAFDPATGRTPTDAYYFLFLYDTLLHQQADGTYSSGLAKSADVLNPTTIEVELLPNLVFSDGTVLDAEAVKASLERNIASNNISMFRMAELGQVGSITVNSPTKLTIGLKTPIAGQFFNLLANHETVVYSPAAARAGTLATKPVGAGPFRLKSADQGRLIAFEKNPRYHLADEVQLAGIELITVATDPQATVNALNSKAVDQAAVTLQQVSAVETAGLETLRPPSDSNMLIVQWCKNRAPFDNVKVRQAISYGLDRNEMNELLYSGQSTPTWANWPETSPNFNKGLDNYYKYNPKKAKALLKEANVSSLTFDLNVGVTGTDQARAGEIIKAQLADIGVTVNLVNFQNLIQEFYIDVKSPASMTTYPRAGIDKITRILSPGSVGNVCAFNDPTLNALVDKLKSLEDGSKEFQKTWQEADDYIIKNALNVYLVWVPRIVAWNPDRLGGVTWRPDVFGAPRLDVVTTYIKKAK